MVTTKTVVTDSPEQTRALARRIGELCRGGETLLLSGDLGSGKTCFTQGLALGLGVRPDMHITSPTFTLHGEYEGRLLLNHLDLYRLEEAESLIGLGIEDMLADQNAVTVMEWPELAVETVGSRRLDIRFEHLENCKRRITFSTSDQRHELLLAATEGDS